MKTPSAFFLFLYLISFANLNAQLETVVEGLGFPSGISVYNNKLYITQAFTDRVSSFDLDEVNATVEQLANLDTPSATFVLGDNLYIGNGVGDNAGVYRLNLLDAEPTPELVVELPAVNGLIIRDSILYLSDPLEESVFAFDLTDENAELELIANEFAVPAGLAISGNDLFVAEFNGGQVSKIDLTDNSTSVFLTDFDRPYGLSIAGGQLYISDNAEVNLADPNAAEPTKTLVVDGLESVRELAFRGSELYITQAIGFFNTGIVSRFQLPVAFPGDSCQIALGIDSLLGGEIGEQLSSRLYDNADYSPIGADEAPGCFAGGNETLERTVWYRFIGDGNTYEIKTGIEGAADPIIMGDTRIALYAGNCDNLSQVACNQDENTDIGLFNGRVVVTTEVDANYFLLVDDANGIDTDGGEFRVAITRLQPSSVRAIGDLGNALYPNPTTGTIYFRGQLPVRVEVMDALGRRVFMQNNVVANQLDLSELVAGSYTVLLQFSGGQMASSKLIRQ